MRTLAWIMVLVGTPIAVGAFYFALKPIADMYRQAATDPLADSMPSDGKGVAKEMRRARVGGLADVVCDEAPQACAETVTSTRSVRFRFRCV
jgi:hypothetical protein